eukprot:778478-Ditylum_brightwellii.AAC.1
MSQNAPHVQDRELTELIHMNIQHHLQEAIKKAEHSLFQIFSIYKPLTSTNAQSKAVIKAASQVGLKGEYAGMVLDNITRYQVGFYNYNATTDILYYELDASYTVIIAPSQVGLSKIKPTHALKENHYLLI